MRRAIDAVDLGLWLVAERVVTEIVDDIDGTRGAEEVTFAFDGVVYDIDLAADNAQRLADALAPFVRHARRSTTSRLMRVTKLDRNGKRISQPL